jgi:hypothetical protein
MPRRHLPIRALLVLSSLLVAAVGCGGPPAPTEFPKLAVRDSPNDAGAAVQIDFEVSKEQAARFTAYEIQRATSENGPFLSIQTLRPDKGETSFDHVDSGTEDTPPPKNGTPYYYRVIASGPGASITSQVAGPVSPSAQWWDTSKLAVFLAVLVFSLFVAFFIQMSRRNPDIYVRPIGGLAALSEAIGRATEMGRPVLYVPGIMDIQDIQTITSLVIMREVAQRTAEYETPIIVPCISPVVLTAAEEAVRTGCMEAGKPELFRRDNVRFLSDEQFAFTAATNGIMLREHPAANIYIGSFYAESLILAETGFLAGAIQIAGTANVSQLPFFVAACDYTLMGEEIYAASAYLSREPMLLGSLKGSDWAKVLFALLIAFGVIFASIAKNGHFPLGKAFVEFFK